MNRDVGTSPSSDAVQPPTPPWATRCDSRSRTCCRSGDRSPKELAQRVDLPTNLLAHHLRDGGGRLDRPTTSEGDGAGATCSCGTTNRSWPRSWPHLHCWPREACRLRVHRELRPVAARGRALAAVSAIPATQPAPILPTRVHPVRSPSAGATISICAAATAPVADVIREGTWSWRCATRRTNAELLAHGLWPPCTGRCQIPVRIGTAAAFEDAFRDRWPGRIDRLDHSLVNQP